MARNNPLNNSLQKYNRSGTSKVIPPTKTLAEVIEKINRIRPAILERYFEIKKDTGIPQYYIRGTDHYATFVNRIGRAGFTRSSNGKGYKKIHALVSGLMEMAERYSCNNHLIYRPGETTILPFRSLAKGLYGEEEFFSNPVFRKKTEVVDRKYYKDANLIWHEAINLEGEKSLIPVSLTVYMHEITNGMASGNTLEEALLHGICEVIERHLKGLVRGERITPPTLDPKTIKYKTVKTLLEKFEKKGYKITFKNYSLDLGVPAVAAIRKMGKGKVVVTVGVAPHPEEAIVRALTENSQGDILMDLKYYHHLFRRSKLESFADLPNIYDKSIKKEIMTIKSLLEKKNMKIWYLDCTDKVMRVPAAIVVITNTRRNSLDFSYRNIIIGLIEEGLKIGDYKQSQKYIKLGKIKDRRNKPIYDYFEGVVNGHLKNYKKAVESFNLVKTHKPLYEMRTYLHLQIASAYVGLGEYGRAVDHFCRNIGKYPVMRYLYLRPHHQFLDAKTSTHLKNTYDELMVLSKNIDIFDKRIQRSYAEKLEAFK